PPQNRALGGARWVLFSAYPTIWPRLLISPRSKAKVSSCSSRSVTPASASANRSSLSFVSAPAAFNRSSRRAKSPKNGQRHRQLRNSPEQGIDWEAVSSTGRNQARVLLETEFTLEGKSQCQKQARLCHALGKSRGRNWQSCQRRRQRKHIFRLKQLEAGRNAEDVAREVGVSEAHELVGKELQGDVATQP